MQELYEMTADDLVSLLQELNQEFKDTKKVAIREVARYDDITFRAIEPFINKLVIQIRKATDAHARLFWIPRHKQCLRNAKNYDSNQSDFNEWYEYEVYIAWYGTPYL